MKAKMYPTYRCVKLNKSNRKENRHQDLRIGGGRFVRLDRLKLLNELRLQLHGAKAINLAVNIVVTIDQTNVFNFRANLEH